MASSSGDIADTAVRTKIISDFQIFEKQI